LSEKKVKLEDLMSQYLVPKGPKGSIFSLKHQQDHRDLATGF